MDQLTDIPIQNCTVSYYNVVMRAGAVDVVLKAVVMVVVVILVVDEVMVVTAAMVVMVVIMGPVNSCQ